jgi:hypothetical protein
MLPCSSTQEQGEAIRGGTWQANEGGALRPHHHRMESMMTVFEAFKQDVNAHFDHVSDDTNDQISTLEAIVFDALSAINQLCTTENTHDN